MTLNGRTQRRKDVANWAALALRRGGWRGLVLQEKRPLRLPGETTDFTNAEAEPKRGKLCIHARGLCSLHAVLAPQFYEESHCWGLMGHGAPKGFFLPRGPHLFRGRGAHPAEGLTQGARARLSLVFPPTRFGQGTARKAVFLTEEIGYRWQGPLLLSSLPCQGTCETKGGRKDQKQALGPQSRILLADEPSHLTSASCPVFLGQAAPGMSE